MNEKNRQEIVYGVHPLQQALALGKRECYKIILEKGKQISNGVAFLVATPFVLSLSELANTHRPSGKYVENNAF